MIQPITIKYGDGRTDRVQVPIVTATELDKGDFISYESNVAVLVDAITEDDTFVGIAETTSGVGDTDDLVCLLKCIIECDVVSGDYTIGQALTYSAKNTLTGAAAGGTTCFGWSTEYKTSATRLRVLIDVPALQKLFPRY